MADVDETAMQQTAGWPEVKSGPLMTGGILVGIGAVLALAGAVVAGGHVVAATRAWMNSLETPPGQLARLKWEQAQAAAAAGQDAWQKHPNAQLRLVRRTTVVAS